MKLCKKIAVVAIFLTIFLSKSLSAQSSGNDIITQIKEQVLKLGCEVFKILFYLATGIAALFILFSGVKYITSESPDDRYEARNRIIYAIIGLIVVLIACPLVEYFIQGTPMEWEKRPDCCPIFSFTGTPPSDCKSAGGACKSTSTCMGDYQCFSGFKECFDKGDCCCIKIKT